MLRFRRGGRHHIGVSPNSWNKAPSVTAHRFVSSDVEGKCCPARTSVHGTDRKGTHATITVNQTHRRLGQLVQDLSSKHSPHNRAASVHTQDLTSSSGEQREPNQQRCSTDSKKDSRCNSGSDKQGCVSTDEGGNLNVEDEHSKVVQFLHRHGMNMNTISMVATCKYLWFIHLEWRVQYLPRIMFWLSRAMCARLYGFTGGFDCTTYCGDTNAAKHRASPACAASRFFIFRSSCWRNGVSN